MKNLTKALFSSFLSILFALSPAFSAAAAPELLGTYGDWKTYRTSEDGRDVCYMLSAPQSMEGEYKKRDPAYAMLTRRPHESPAEVFSFDAGYPYQDWDPVKLSIDHRDYALLGKGETAWAKDSATDKAIADGLGSGAKMIIAGKSARGTATLDRFSLKGSAEAYAKMEQACQN